MTQHHLRRLKEVFSSNTCVKQTPELTTNFSVFARKSLFRFYSLAHLFIHAIVFPPPDISFRSFLNLYFFHTFLPAVLSFPLSHWAVGVYRFLRPAPSPPLYHHYVHTAFHSVRLQSLNCGRMRQTTFCLVKLLPACFQHVGRLCVWVINSAAVSVSPFPESHLLSLFLLLEWPINHFLRVPVFCRGFFTHVSFRGINKVTCYPLFSLYVLWTVCVFVFRSLTSEQQGNLWLCLIFVLIFITNCLLALAIVPLKYWTEQRMVRPQILWWQHVQNNTYRHTKALCYKQTGCVFVFSEHFPQKHLNRAFIHWCNLCEPVSWNTGVVVCYTGWSNEEHIDWKLCVSVCVCSGFC